MLIRTLLLIVVALCSGLSATARAVSQVDIYHFDSTEQRERYNSLIEEFRCPKCLNINIAGSDAPIARDLRRTVHKLVVVDGMTDQQVRDFLQARYGDFVLYDPPFNARTWLVWVMPFVLAVVALGVLFFFARNKRGGKTLDAASQDRLRALLNRQQS
ncbi:MAG: cytochrome c-type biogenesis protein [Pseudomonadota bacterium]